MYDKAFIVKNSSKVEKVKHLNVGEVFSIENYYLSKIDDKYYLSSLRLRGSKKRKGTFVVIEAKDCIIIHDEKQKPAFKVVAQALNKGIWNKDNPKITFFQSGETKFLVTGNIKVLKTMEYKYRFV